MRLNGRGKQIMDDIIADVQRAQRELENARVAAAQQKGIGYELWEKRFNEMAAKYEAGIRALRKMRNN